ncbi:MAG: 50S ribosomal protein L29 [Clostridia bacterium]|jgi:large subunit ribosomal protein L29|nr:50S ribosomal protein L29 [Oscillospiraceae bacterium]MBO5735368.1 50S ribosomal protein L29 [Clostridia bacterium]MBQ8323641.1 50S ribosomal protein L29 [Clostridia bacterium]MBR4054263.1 50S ribosomal protein L29 [Clostridia bacterium]MBR5263225.1 50S ribosomal protein L29 [Clostridia bacterium]
MDIREIKELSASELEKAIKEQKEALFNLRFQHSINQLENPMKIVETKKTIARMLTVLREKQLAENA